MIGSVISHYRILEQIGEGGMGVVYKAEDVRLKRTVAVKFLPKKLSVHSEERERFIHEAQAASSLNHPNICVIHEIDEVKDETFMVMEFIDGKTLREWIMQKSAQPEGYRKLGVQEFLRIAIQIAEGLEKAHEKGIIHRDIKSENIMVTVDGHAKIMDFGLAKLRGVSKLTKTGSTVGTVAYMSPEQVEGIETDHRTDIFSFGVVLYEMLAGQLPFRAEHETAMMYEIINVEPPSLLDIHKNIDAELNRIVIKCLEKDREVRYQSMKDVIVDLKRFKRASEGKPVERGVEKSSPAETQKAVQAFPSRTKSKWWKIGAAGAAVVLLIGIGIYFFKSGSRHIDSIAVLPLVNVGADPNTEYLSDGFTESLINTISRLPGIKMMSRSSVFRFKGKEIDPHKAAQELGVSAVLTGRVMQHGDELSISVELINAKDDSHIWGDQYNRKISDIISLQTEIAREVSNQLKITLTGDQQKLLSERATENSEAYQMYLKGRFYWNKRNKEGFERAIQYFNKAIDIDPSYAMAYAGLADVYAVMGGYYLITPKESADKARAAANKALAFNESLAEPHVTLAAQFESYDWDWASAEREYKRALELNPNYATAHQWYGEYLCAMGRLKEGLAENDKAIELDPLSPVHYVSSFYSFIGLHRYDDGIRQVKKALELDQSFSRAHAALGQFYLLKGMNSEAIAELKAAIELSDSSLQYLADLAYAYGYLGERTEAERILKSLLQTEKQKYVSPALIGAIYIGLGEKDIAFYWLDRAVEEHDASMEFIKTIPILALIREDPRYARLVKKVGLPQ